MESFVWVVLVAAASLFLLLGVAGGDVLATSGTVREEPAMAFAKWLWKSWMGGQRRAVQRGVPPKRPARAMPSRQPAESGLHAVV